MKEKQDLTKPRFVVEQQTWKISDDATYWVDVFRADRMGLKFFQTISNAIIFSDIFPPICIENVVKKGSQKRSYTPKR